VRHHGVDLFREMPNQLAPLAAAALLLQLAGPLLTQRAVIAASETRQRKEGA
jgi:hypothetical protein